MKIIDEFFSATELDLFKKLVQEQQTDDNRLPYQNYAGDGNDYTNEIIGTNNSYISVITGEPRLMFLQKLVDQNLMHPGVMKRVRRDAKTSNVMLDLISDLTYLSAQAPYQCLWHQDRVNQDDDIPDYVPITFYLNKDWNDQDGGVYFYRSDNNESEVVFVSPVENRLVHNYKDLIHGTTPVVNPNVVRSSCQIFVNRLLLK
jgi:hypothetical protein